ncbi:coproporphyrinogen oxidase, putative [Eimeria acervulina]|uniref:coproporphyrinogen oxidase n=1 Tax=Eimeria acervulina TaxID=5801 RepID=U6GLN7_EIMAC|nr:coproporphyrinogen oxidase, putative [Eimeria acervulina]CDI81075.1 coproporphyrinogen oxidase, putative [Eimeria acervulina]
MDLTEAREEHPDGAFREAWVAELYSAQSAICSAIEALEASVAAKLQQQQQQQPQQQQQQQQQPKCAKRFENTQWVRGPGQGGGLTRVIQDGVVFAKGGVNVSAVEGSLPLAAALSMCRGGGEKLRELLRDLLPPKPAAAAAAAAAGGGAAAASGGGGAAGCNSSNSSNNSNNSSNSSSSSSSSSSGSVQEGSSGAYSSNISFFAAGLSLVLHPCNPHAPSSHANYRFFQLFCEGKSICWWFGGGADLSPAYIIEKDCIDFHQALKDMCDRHNPIYYPRFKLWADAYYRLPHRGEARGIGGIFFDYLNDECRGKLKEIKEFCVDGLHSFAPIYLDIVQRRCCSSYTQQQLRWMLIRRGRYIEFNLICDRGTKFGLALPGSIAENILMSLPLEARWEYTPAPPSPSSLEGKTLQLLIHPRDWVSFDKHHLKGFVVPHEEDRPLETKNKHPLQYS